MDSTRQPLQSCLDMPRYMTIQGGTFTTALTYNDQGQVLTESYTGGPLDGISVTNGYDSLLRRTNLVARNTSVLTTTLYGYDAASRLQTVSDGTNSATYSYLANSPLVSQILFQQSGSTRMTTTKQYDYLNRLTYIGSANPSSVVLDSHSYAYNTANQRTSVTNADGTHWVYGYDELGQVTSGVKYWPDGTVVAGQQFGYAFDDIGNRTSTAAGGDQWGRNLRYASYSANTLNQYTSRTVPGAVDIIGSATNTATVTVNNLPTYRKGDYYRNQLPITNSSGPVWQSVTDLAVYNSGTNYIVETNITGNVFVPQTPENFAYDADGNLTNDGRWIYTWDGENRLVAMTNNANVPTGARMGLTFAYDAKGRRVGKSVNTNGVVTTYAFVYDGWNLEAILNAPSSTLAQAFAWGLDLSGSLQRAGGVGGLLFESQPEANSSFVSYDGNGNVTILVDATTGTISAQYEYGPFGELIRASGPMAKANPFRFSTKYVDDETDLLYYGYRFFNPSTGRWLSRDPMEEDGGINIYVFSGNDGVDYCDPLGEAFFNFSLPLPPSAYISLGIDDKNLHFELGGTWVPKPIEKLEQLWNRSSWRRYHIGTLQAGLSIFGSVDISLNGLNKETKICGNVQLAFALIKQKVGNNGRFTSNDNWGIGLYASGSICLYPCTGDITYEYEGAYFVKFGNGGTKKNWKDWFNIGGKISDKGTITRVGSIPKALGCHCKN